MQENIAVISIKNIKSNLKSFRSLLSPAVKEYAVVKANAYGHGAERVAEGVQKEADGFVVTSVREGVAVRLGGAVKEILVLTPPLDEDDVFLAAAHGLSLTVCSLASLRTVEKAVRKFGICADVHLKVDTGMNRLGVCGPVFSRLCSALSESEGIRARGVYSHLFSPANESARQAQLVRFLRAKETAENKLGRLTCHLSATGGVLCGREYHFDAVRIGIGMYGYLPDGFERFEKTLRLRPAMKLYTHALQSHRFTGGGVGYASAEEEYGDLTAYRLGYADGFLRSGGGARLGAIGTLCMDSCVKAGRCGYGERRLVFSSVAKMAKETGTIPYEVLCAASRRARLEYVEY